MPLIVKPANDEGLSGIVAGARRWVADGIVRAEGVDHGPLACAILEAGDDTDAIEASMIENLARLDPDEVTQWETFVRLVKEGCSVEDIGATFGPPDLAIRRVLALGNLLPRIRDLYRQEKVDAATVRHLTMASKSQQRTWLALLDDPAAHAPTGHQLKAWLFGGQAIPARYALFDLDGFKGPILGDLFGEDRNFADPDAFWTDAVIVPPNEHFQSWEHEKVAKRKGGRVYIVVRASGEVAFHEGYLSRKEAAKAVRVVASSQPVDDGPEPTAPTAVLMLPAPDPVPESVPQPLAA